MRPSSPLELRATPDETLLIEKIILPEQGGYVGGFSRNRPLVRTKDLGRPSLHSRADIILGNTALEPDMQEYYRRPARAASPGPQEEVTLG